jgi:hypothetical protein
MEALRMYFNHFIKLSDAEWADFEQCLSKEKVENKKQILSEGEKCNFIAFIQEGAFRFW